MRVCREGEGGRKERGRGKRGGEEGREEREEEREGGRKGGGGKGGGEGRGEERKGGYVKEGRHICITTLTISFRQLHADFILRI